MHKIFRPCLTALLLVPQLAYTACQPSFETVPGALARTWSPIPSSLPAYGEQAIWNHPTLDDGHRLRVRHIADKQILENAGMEPETLNARHEYSQHSAFSATGRWLISHGKYQRVLFDGMQYKPVRTIKRDDPIRDWHWDPTDDNTAYYVSRADTTVVRYNVEKDTHTPVVDREMAASWFGLDSPGELTLEGNHGQGALSADGTRLVTKFAYRNDAYIVVFEPRSGKYVTHTVFEGLAGSRKLDWQALSPSGEKVLIQGQFDALYNTRFANERGIQQVRVFQVDDFKATRGRLLIGRPSHFDVMQIPSGQEYFVIAGSQPPKGWESLSAQPRGLVQGLYTIDLDSLAWRQHLNFRQRFQKGVPAAHVSAAPDDARVLLSFYQGGNANEDTDAQTTPLLLVDLSEGWRVKTAWLGWDLAANPGRGNSSQGYLAQPHASYSPNVWFADGSRGIKVVWASDNNRPERIIGDMVVAEVICSR